MKQRLSLVIGIFIIMALSNAIVPVLPEFADEMPALQGIIFSAYFFGAFVMVLPAGVLGDRFGRKPFIIAGLLFTVVSGGRYSAGLEPVCHCRRTDCRRGGGCGTVCLLCPLMGESAAEPCPTLGSVFCGPERGGADRGTDGNRPPECPFRPEQRVMLFTGLAVIPP